jgi:hypothetical protein
MSNWSLLMGFSIPIKVVQLLIFSSNKFLKQQTSTFKLTKVKLFTIFKLTCTQFAHSFKKNIVERQKCFHVFNEKKHKIKITSKSLLLDANLLS